MTSAEPLAMTSAMPKPTKRAKPDKEGTRAMPNPPVPLPPNNQPPGWFMPKWLDRKSWFWDAKRVRHVIVLQNHVVQIVGHKKVWRWRVERMTGAGVVSLSGFGFGTATEARRDVLAEFWSDLWTGKPDHERWRQACAQRWPEIRAKAIADERRVWAAEVETEVSAEGRA
jgi:hypothetical protein